MACAEAYRLAQAKVTSTSGLHVALRATSQRPWPHAKHGQTGQVRGFGSRLKSAPTFTVPRTELGGHHVGGA
jgi:hypothetical protein